MLVRTLPRSMQQSGLHPVGTNGWTVSCSRNDGLRCLSCSSSLEFVPADQLTAFAPPAFLSFARGAINCLCCSEESFDNGCRRVTSNSNCACARQPPSDPTVLLCGNCGGTQYLKCAIDFVDSMKSSKKYQYTFSSRTNGVERYYVWPTQRAVLGRQCLSNVAADANSETQ